MRTKSTRKGNIRIMGIPEGEQREKRTDSLFQEIISENFPKLGKELDIHVQQANRRPQGKQTVSQTYIKPVQSQRQRFLKSVRKKTITYKGTPTS